MDAVADVMQREKIRSWVKFEQRTIEDKTASAKEGRFVGRDVDFAIITPAYGKDDVHKKVEAWKDELRVKVMNGQISQEDRDFYLARYEAWKKGLEMPLDGTPIKGWGVISPAQQQLLISVGIMTVESLSTVNDQGIGRIGMGGVELKRKASAWLSQLNDKGPLTQQMTAMHAENDTLKIQVDTLTKQVQALMAVSNSQAPQHRAPDPLSAEALLDEEEPVGRGTGRTKKER